MTVELILSEEMRALWQEMIPPLGPEHVAKVAVGSKGIAKTGLQLKLTDWESILAEVISGEAFGVDRMDYLLRDSLHLGVAAGTFGYQRLIESLRILEPRDETNKPLTAGLGINYGGRHSAHELLVARGFMYSQVYYHPVNRSYRLHLIDFLAAKLSDGKFAIDLEEHLASTDTEVTVALTETAKNPKAAGHDAARRIICRDRREHFRLLDERRPGDADHGPTEPGLAIYTAASEKFGAVNLRHDHPKPDRAPQDFYVQTRDGTVVSSATFPDATMPKAHVIDYIFVAPEIRDQARQWLKSERDEILRRAAEAERETDS